MPITLVFGYLQIKNTNLLRQELYGIQEANVGYIKRTMDFEFLRFRSLSAGLLSSADVNRLRRLRYEDITASDTLRLMSLRGSLNSFTADMSVVSKVCLYMPTSGLLVDTQRALPLADALYTLDDLKLLPADDELWNRMLTGKYRSQWLRAINRQGNQVLYYIQSIPSLYESNLCNLMVILNPAYLSEVFPQEDAAGSEWLAMTAADGTLIYASAELDASIDLTQATGESGHFTAGPWLCTYVRSEQTNTCFYNAVLLSSVNGQLRLSTGLSLAVLLLSFFVCAMITYATTVRNFKPIAYLSSLAQPDMDDPEMDEFTRLRISLMEAIDDKRVRMNQAQYAKAALEDRRLVQALENAKSQAVLEKRLYREELAPVGKAWVMSLVRIVDFSDESLDAQVSFEHIMMQVHDAFAGIMSKAYTVLPLYNDKELLVLTNLPDGEPQQLVYLRTVYASLLDNLRSNFSIDCRIAVSAIHDRAVLNGETFQALMSETQIANDAPHEGESILFYSTQAIDRVMQVSVEHTMHSLLYASLCGATEDTEKYLDQLGQQVRTLTEYQSQTPRESDIDEEDSAEMRLKRSILEIVKNEYPDPMLNVSAIADKLGKNVDYVSRVFKQTTTIGLLDYIHHMRIKAAKELLLHEPTLSVAQISQRVGYFGTDSFIRAFKRIENVTPGKYRAQSKGD